MKILLILLMLMSTSTAFADSDLDKLRQTFNPVIDKAKQEFDRASLMEPVELQQGAALSQEECRIIQDRIRQNYAVDPFEVIYQHGSTFNYMCGGQYGYLKNFILEASGKTNMNLDYNLVIQLEHQSPMSSWDSISNYFINSNFEIVEIQSLSHWPKTNELLNYEVRSSDNEGNIYFSAWTKNYRVVDRDIEGTRTVESFISADGSFPSPLFRSTVKHKTDSKKDYRVLLLKKADKRDWETFALPITHAWSGGFYSYSGELFRYSQYSSSLTIKYRGSKESCAYGDIKAGANYHHYPKEDSLYYDCVNY